jgi:hypothetical protein
MTVRLLFEWYAICHCERSNGRPGLLQVAALRQKSYKASESASDMPKQKGRQFGDNLDAYRHSGKSGSASLMDAAGMLSRTWR